MLVFNSVNLRNFKIEAWDQLLRWLSIWDSGINRFEITWVYVCPGCEK
jgi:hypothetical protein